MLDVAIIGAGTAGLTARREVAKLTDNYKVFDDGILGTTCARVGCMPSKVLIQIAADMAAKKRHEPQGIHSSMGIDVKKAMEHVRALRDRFVRGVHKGMSEWQDQYLIRERVNLIDENTLEYSGKSQKAKNIIVATGSSPVVPWEGVIDTDSFFELPDVGKKIAVIGMGVIGLELGQALSRLGLDVQGFSRRKFMGGVTDPVIADYVFEKIGRDFPITLSSVENVVKNKSDFSLTSNSKTSEYDMVLATLGRKPNLRAIENIECERDERGMPLLEKGTYKIPGKNIYIVGDNNGERTLLHEASDEGRIAGYNAVRDQQTPFQRRVPLSVTFSSPNICTAGKSFKELDGKEDFVTGKVSFEGQGRSIVMLAEVGVLHVYVRKKDGLLLGAEMFAPSGEHMAHLISWAIAANMNVFDTLALPFYHPVVEEGLRTALRDAASQLGGLKRPLEVHSFS